MGRTKKPTRNAKTARAKSAAKAAPAHDADPDVDPGELARLLADLQENPDLLASAEAVPEAYLGAIQRALNPYKTLVPRRASAPQQAVAASHTNLRAGYLRRLAMTSLVGFLYQMRQEWKPPAELLRWKASGESPPPFAAADLASVLSEAADLARAAADASAAIAAAELAASEAGLAALTEPSATTEAFAKAAAEDAEFARARAAGLLYAATHAAHRVGASATARLRATVEAGRQHPEFRAVLENCPLPAEAGEQQVPAEVAANIVHGFLNQWLRFDPSVHVRSGHSGEKLSAAAAAAVADAAADEAAPELTLAEVSAPAPTPAPEHAAAFAELTATPERRSAATALLRPGEGDFVDAALTALENADEFRRYLLPVPAGDPARPAVDVVPPQDTFHRWQYYETVNYEALRTITEALYPERADLELAVAIWEVFEGDDAQKQFTAWCEKNSELVPGAVNLFEVGKWALLGDFKENRRKAEFFNKNTKVLERILERYKDDERIGAELMRNRVHKAKAQNIREDGPDDPKLAAYRRELASRSQEVGGMGAERVISREAMLRLEKAKGDLNAAHELENLDSHLARIAELEARRELSTEEFAELAECRRELVRIREQVEVPENAVQVDVFTVTGDTMTKSAFYSRSDEPSEAGEEANVIMDLGAQRSTHPAVASSVASAVATGAASVSYADYAVKHMRDGASGSGSAQ